MFNNTKLLPRWSWGLFSPSPCFYSTTQCYPYFSRNPLFTWQAGEGACALRRRITKQKPLPVSQLDRCVTIVSVVGSSYFKSNDIHRIPTERLFLLAFVYDTDGIRVASGYVQRITTSFSSWLRAEASFLASFVPLLCCHWRRHTTTCRVTLDN